MEVNDGNNKVEISRADEATNPESAGTMERIYAPPLWARMPNTAFGIGLGLGGQTIMWKTLSMASHFPIIGPTTNKVFWGLALAAMGIILILYVYKAIKYPFVVKAEWKNPVRSHFFSAPHVFVLMVSIGVPNNLVQTKNVLRVIFGVTLGLQTILTNPLYIRWLFDANASIKSARPQFLFSCVGWFFLAVLGLQTNISDEWGINIPAFCFGSGLFLYLIIITSNFLSLSRAAGVKKSPAMFLFIAPPSVAVIAAEGFYGGFLTASQFLLGWCLVLLVLLIRIVPSVEKSSSSFGTYWAYVFPLAGIATSSVRYAESQPSIASCGLAYILVAVSLITLLAVFVREVYNFWEMSNHEKHPYWPDPVVTAHLDKFEQRVHVS
mmetsp:Transcript_54418/g.80780  ORF Transcript_54418/g.80780 Transcript_54418/m.80780 type:complete len:380 (+) Transcript_54418:36-1175(+)